jgi:hypothetical protein
MLSLAKGCCKRRSSLYYSLGVCYSTFCLEAKGGAKKSRQARTAPRVLPPTHNNSHYIIHHLPTSFQAACFTILRNFFKKPCFSFKLSRLQALYPAFLFLK